MNSGILMDRYGKPWENGGLMVVELDLCRIFVGFTRDGVIKHGWLESPRTE